MTSRQSDEEAQTWLDLPTIMNATAIAHSNIALVKYWGKRNQELNLPAAGSISVTLSNLFSQTTVRFGKDLQRDLLYLNNSAASISQTARVNRFLDVIRRKAGLTDFAEVRSQNNFPTAAGLASSAAGFGALTLAACQAARLSLSREELSALARQGSGSAARSIFGGFVEMKAGRRADGSDAHAISLEHEKFWPLHILVVITSTKKKETGSTSAMEATAASSPYYQEWLRSSHEDLTEMRSAIYQRDLDKVGEIAEHNCLKMHSLTMTSRPAVIYWNGTTVDIIHVIRQLRRWGTSAFFTIDAGSHVMVLCAPADSRYIKQVLEQVDGVNRVLISTPGPAAHIVGSQS